MTNKKFKVLVTETVGELGLDILRRADDVELIERYSISKEEIKIAIADVDGILTRSGTTMDEETINAANNLKVIGRAGVGVDNINLPMASKRGIIVINAPSGNTLAATELTMGCMLSAVRKIPQACSSLRNAEWNRNRFTGTQLHNKKLLIIGLGRIGSAIATRCKAFGMDIIAYDPYISQRKADSLRVELINNLEDAISMADIVTIHTPLTRETKNLINEETLRLFKKGAYLINCARGGIVNEIAITDALRSGHIKAFGTDVYSSEPLTHDHPYLAKDLLDKIVITPHIGANTVEAQSEVSRISVENMLAVLRNEPYAHAVNIPFMEQALSNEQKMYLNLARKMGLLVAKFAMVRSMAVNNVKVTLRGNLFDLDDLCSPKSIDQYRPYTIATLKGMLEVGLGEEVSYMMAPIIAKDRHITIEETTGDSITYKNTIEVDLETEKGNLTLVATITEEGRQRVVKVNDYWVDFVPTGNLFVFQNHDKPCVIGNIGQLLGKSGINIANFTLGRKDKSGLALGALEVEGTVSDEIISKLIDSGDLVWGTSVDFLED
ncbi:MAG: phosphoglycerate dehydrogenase [Synergistaceae bacterium]